MEQKQKRRLGDRKDGRRLRSIDPLNSVASYIMVNRSGASNLFSDTVDIDVVERYIRHKRKDENLAGFGLMHVLIATYVRCISQKPGINRFISGQRTYARNDIEVNMAVKLEMSAEGSETIIKIRPGFDATATDIYHLMTDAIEFARSDKDSSFDSAAKILNYIPGVFLKFAIWFLKGMDYFGLLPKGLTSLSPFHGTLFITSMGSLGIPPIYHHLYDFGNVPVFCSFGAKERRSVLQSDGAVTEKRFITCNWVTDERICDGFYYASAFKLIRSILRDPYQLDAPPEKIIRDVD